MEQLTAREMHKNVSPKFTICFMDLASYLKISLKPILTNNIETIIQSGANNISSGENMDSHLQ